MSRYRFIEAQHDHYPVRLLCQLVAVPTSGYYAWQQAIRRVGPAGKTALVKVFGVHKRCYGTRRLRVEQRRKDSVATTKYSITLINSFFNLMP